MGKGTKVCSNGPGNMIESAKKVMVQTPVFMILRRGIKPHNMSLASIKHINSPWDSLL